MAIELRPMLLRDLPKAAAIIAFHTGIGGCFAA
jgi:hypothetical protein